MGDKFEKIEHEQLGEDGFEDALRQIAAIEQTFGYAPTLPNSPHRPCLTREHWHGLSRSARNLGMENTASGALE